MRTLLAVGRLQHLRPHPPEQQPDLERRLQVRQQRSRVRAVPAPAVRRRRSGRRRIRHQRLVPQQVLVQVPEAPPAHRARRRRPLHRPGERVVPARVQQHESQRRPRRRHQQVVQRHRLVAHIDVALEPRVHRHDVVHSVHLDAVAGVEHERDVRPRAPPRERPQRLRERHPIGVELCRHVEPEPLQRGGHVGRIVLGIQEPADVGVGAVAHHQRHAARRQRDGRRRHQNDRQKQDDAELRQSHPPSPPDTVPEPVRDRPDRAWSPRAWSHGPRRRSRSLSGPATRHLTGGASCWPGSVPAR